MIGVMVLFTRGSLMIKTINPVATLMVIVITVTASKKADNNATENVKANEVMIFDRISTTILVKTKRISHSQIKGDFTYKATFYDAKLKLWEPLPVKGMLGFVFYEKAKPELVRF